MKFLRCVLLVAEIAEVESICMARYHEGKWDNAVFVSLWTDPLTKYNFQAS